MIKNHYIKTMRILILVLIILMFLAGNVWSDKIEVGGYEFSATPRQGKLNKSHRTIMGFTVGKHSLKDVQAKLGKTEIFSTKEHAPSQICYISKQPDRTIIVFEAGAMGGWKDLTGFKIISNKINFEEVNKCKESAVIAKNIKTLSGIKLGISENMLKAILGEPIKKIDNNLFYVYESLEKKRAKKTYDIFSYIHAIFMDLKMESISITYVETSY